MEIQAAITKTFWLYTTAVAILISKEYKICCTIYLWASNSGLSTTKMFLNISFSFLLFLSSSYSLKTEKQGLCSPPVVEPSPVQHLWAEDGLEVYRIFLAVLAALYLHRWLTEWLMIHHLERSTWQCNLLVYNPQLPHITSNLLMYSLQLPRGCHGHHGRHCHGGHGGYDRWQDR